ETLANVTGQCVGLHRSRVSVLEGGQGGTRMALLGMLFALDRWASWPPNALGCVFLSWIFFDFVFFGWNLYGSCRRRPLISYTIFFVPRSLAYFWRNLQVSFQIQSCQRECSCDAGLATRKRQADPEKPT